MPRSFSLSNSEGGQEDAPLVDSEGKRPIFHEDFNKRRPRAVILQSDDKGPVCYYYPLAPLQFLSSFFRDLPPPSSGDLVGDTPLIPLLDTSSCGLSMFLLAIQSIDESKPFRVPQFVRHAQYGAVCEAAIMGRRLGVPLLPRLLQEGLSASSEEDSFLIFAIWAISDVHPMTARAAERTIEHDITGIRRDVVTALCQHAPDAWIRLQGLHLRRLKGIDRFRRAYYSTGSVPGCDYCGELSLAITDAIRIRFEAAKTVKEIEQVGDRDWGLECGYCAQNAIRQYDDLMEWFGRYTSNYTFDHTYEEYKDL